MNFCRDTGVDHDGASPGAIRTAVLMTVGTIVLTLALVIGLAAAGYPAPVPDEIAMAPIAW